MSHEQPPAPVRQGSLLVGVCALLSALGTIAVILALRQLSTTGPHYIHYLALDPLDAAKEVDGVRLDIFGFAAATVPGVLALTPVAFLLRRPRPAARRVATIVGCYEAFVMLLAFGDMNLDPANQDGVAGSASFMYLLPSWFFTAATLLSGAIVVTAVAFCLVLRRTAAADFYHLRSAGDDGLWRFASLSRPVE